jgi:acyl-CoA thioester hydrolase
LGGGNSEPRKYASALEKSQTRRIQKLPFPEDEGAPAPLEARVARRVRFEEVDPLGIVWHGRYPSYFEDGRAAFGQAHGLGYLDMRNAGFMAPIVQMHIEYHAPLRFPEEFWITARLHWTDAVRLNFSYRIENGEGAVAATGVTVQLIQNLEGQLLLLRPDFLEDFWRRWRAGARS